MKISFSLFLSFEGLARVKVVVLQQCLFFVLCTGDDEEFNRKLLLSNRARFVYECPNEEKWNVTGAVSFSVNNSALTNNMTINRLRNESHLQGGWAKSGLFFSSWEALYSRY